MPHCLHYPKFTNFETIMVCDNREMDGQTQANSIYHASIASQGKNTLPEIFRTELVTLYTRRQCNVALSRRGAVHSNGTKFVVVIANVIVET